MSHVSSRPRMPLEFRHFALVIAVAETGSLTAASRRLHVTPSALSHQLRDAEERLGTQLFQRRNRRLLLTGAGEVFLASARRVTSEVARAEAGCRSEAPSDLLRISTGCYTAYGWLPAILGRWQADHPRVELRIVLEATRRPIPSLLDGALDLALTTDAPGHPRLQQSRLFADELLAVLPAGHALARRPHVTAEDLAGEHILTYDAPRDQLDMFTRVMWPAGVEPRRVSRVPPDRGAARPRTRRLRRHRVAGLDASARRRRPAHGPDHPPRDPPPLDRGPARHPGAAGPDGSLHRAPPRRGHREAGGGLTLSRARASREPPGRWRRRTRRRCRRRGADRPGRARALASPGRAGRRDRATRTRWSPRSRRARA